MNKALCWCGNGTLNIFNKDYAECGRCKTLVSKKGIPAEKLLVKDDESDFYGKKYWLTHQKDDLSFPDIHSRSRNDLSERNLFWLKTLLKYQAPPARILEIGCAHGSFVALLRKAGFDAAGLEMSPWVVEYGKQIFNIPISIGPVENLPIPSEKFDVIALMDVLEHLPDPIATMTYCMKLLRPGGILLIQTPEYKEGMDYKSLLKLRGPFLEQLKADEHLYLFNRDSVAMLFKGIGTKYIKFEPAIFGPYGMFFAVSSRPLKKIKESQIEQVLLGSVEQRFVLALLDAYSRGGASSKLLEAEKEHVIEQLKASEDDRAARLKVIETQAKELDRIPQLEAEKEHVIEQLKASEDDRAALRQSKWLKLGFRLKLLSLRERK